MRQEQLWDMIYIIPYYKRITKVRSKTNNLVFDKLLDKVYYRRMYPTIFQINEQIHNELRKL